VSRRVRATARFSDISTDIQMNRESPCRHSLACEEARGDRRLAVVPFQDEGALVIESRRPTGWSSDWPETRTGLLAYFVDTELEIDRVDSFTEAGCGSSPDQPKWAYHLFKDEFSGDCRSFDNAFLRSGETLSFNGVQITLVHSTETVDYVEVSTQNR